MRYPALQRCIAQPADTFLASTYSRSPLISRRNELKQDFSDLFSLDDVNGILSGGLRTSSVRLVQGDHQLRADQFGYAAAAGDEAGIPPYVDTARVAGYFSEGYSVVLRSLHRYHAPVIAFSHNLSKELGYAVRVNGYVAPPNSQAVSTHFDLQDVFVIQIHGDKEWNIYQPPIEKPVSTEAWQEMPRSRREDLLSRSPQLESVVLAPGDVLYVPRGCLHNAKTASDTSIQLTVAIMTVTRFDLFQHLAQMAAKDDWFRESVPPREDLQIADELPSLLIAGVERLAKLIAQLSGDELLWHLRREQHSDLPPAPIDIISGTTYDQEARYIVRPGVRFALTEKGDSVKLRLENREILFPRSAATILKAILEGCNELECTTSEELPRPVHDSVTRALVKSGVLVRQP